jgi:diguanylate cyclase (GGDEF)-like protein
MKRNENIVALENELARLTKLVYYDELTGILNRRGFLEEAEKQFRGISFGKTPLERRVGIQIPFSIVYIDLDDFKKINDSFGHDAGDLALQNVAVVLREQLRASDVFARWGGEEFVVALVGASAESARIAAEKIRQGIESREMKFEGKNFHVTASFGIKAYQKEKSLTGIIAAADKAMYSAKRLGKNRVVIFDGK